MARTYASKIEEVKQTKDQLDQKNRYKYLNSMVLNNQKIEKQVNKQTKRNKLILDAKKEKKEDKLQQIKNRMNDNIREYNDKLK